jgi:tryptophan 7-halogenase
MARIRKVVIVGGGTAGWMSAATLSRAFGSLLEIELIESDQIGTVGVGEATIPQIRLLLGMLGIDEYEFLAATNGTFKLGIQFNGWTRPGDSYIHAFGGIGRALGMLEFHHYWLRSRAQGSSDSLWTYSLNAAVAMQNRYERFDVFGETGLSGLVRAYHFDASLVARYLRGYSERHGVARTEGRIVDTAISGDSGFIESVRLEDGVSVSGDLFIDCSGFRGLLIEGALDTGYEDWTHWLPCDRAAAVPCETTDPLLPYTQSTARKAGWQWRIPLQNRTGNGHVYCSSFISDDEASSMLMENLDGKPLGEPRLLRFTPGRRRKFWNRNCVALGLASGFLEPLESTSIHLVQSGLSRLISLFPQMRTAPELIAEYNRQCICEFERVRDFLILHYHANERVDSQFWIERREMPVPESLTQKLELFRASGRIREEAEDLFKQVAWLQVMLGQRIVPDSYHPLADMPTPAQLNRFLGDLRRAIQGRARSFPDHRSFVQDHCPAKPH